MQQFRIAINKLSGWLFSRVLASHPGCLGLNFGRDMSVLGPLVYMMEMTLVKSLHSGQLGNKPSALQALFGLHPSAAHVCSCMFM